MKKIFLILTTVSLATFLSFNFINKVNAKVTNNNNEIQTVKVGLEGDFPPYAYKKDGRMTGFEYELSQKLSQKMHVKNKYYYTPWDSLIAGLNSHRFDMVINNMTVNPKREKQYLLSTPYLYSREVLITKKGSSVKNIDQIKGKPVAEGNGTDNAEIAKKFGAKVITSPDFQTTTSMLEQNRAVATLNAEPAFNAWKQEHKNSNLSASIIPKSKVPTAKIAILFNKDSGDLKNKTNRTLKELYKDGTMKKLSNKYFGKDITKDS